MIRKFMFCRLHHNLLKLFRLNKSISILIEKMKRLSNPLPRQPPQHLRELRIVQPMSRFTRPHIQWSPITIPIKRDPLPSLFPRKHLLKGIVRNRPRTLHVEKTERNIVFCIRFCKEIFKRHPILKVYCSTATTVCDEEKNGVLFAFDFMVVFPLGGYCVDESGFAEDEFSIWLALRVAFETVFTARLRGRGASQWGSDGG